MIICASASTDAAPPMSFFIRSIALDGLRSSPPVSKQTPLPTSVIFGWRGWPQVDVDQPRRAVGGTCRRRGSVENSSLRRSSPVVQRELRTECRGERLRGRVFELFRAHVVCRRVDEVARQHRGLRHARLISAAVDVIGQHQLGRRGGSALR